MWKIILGLENYILWFTIFFWLLAHSLTEEPIRVYEIIIILPFLIRFVCKKMHQIIISKQEMYAFEVEESDQHYLRYLRLLTGYLDQNQEANLDMDKDVHDWKSLGF